MLSFHDCCSVTIALTPSWPWRRLQLTFGAQVLL